MPARGEPAPGGSRVHHDSLAGVGARLCPSGLATATPQPFTVASPGQLKTTRPEVPFASTHVRTHRARPVSARFEPVNALKGVVTPVPRVLLSVSLAGPAPSGSPGHTPASSGLLPPSPAPPGSGCPQLQRPAATGRRRRSLTSTRTTAPHGARKTASEPLVVVKLSWSTASLTRGFFSLSSDTPRGDQAATKGSYQDGKRSVMRAVLRHLLLSPDPRTLPGDPAEFAFGVQLVIGPADGPGEESFELTVCSPEWLAERCRSGELVNGLHHVIVGWDIYDEQVLRGCPGSQPPCIGC